METRREVGQGWEPGEGFPCAFRAAGSMQWGFYTYFTSVAFMCV